MLFRVIACLLLKANVSNIIRIHEEVLTRHVLLDDDGVYAH